MSSLPHEVLLLVFLDLNKKELLQCQLTCKQWDKASLERVYSDVNISSEKKATLYTRTISTSPPLAKQLNIIRFNNAGDRNDIEISFAKHEALDAVIQYCPNVTQMVINGTRDFQFWPQLMYAATQGRLSNLQRLPLPVNVDLRMYLYTALLFKNSLVQLDICDDGYLCGLQLARLGVYQTLCDQIDQFKNLLFLSLSCISNDYLSYFDGFIDKCRHLQELTFDLVCDGTLSSDLRPRPDELEPVISPRPDIQMLECNWGVLDADNQIEYIIRKFPGLKKLIVLPDLETEEEHILTCSGPALIKFTQYALSIPYFRINANISDQDLVAIWAEIMKTKYGSTTLSIEYRLSDHTNTIQLSSENGIAIVFPLDTDDVFDGHEPPHIPFFSEAGATIRSLIIFRSDLIPSRNREVRDSIDWLYEILQRCPSMEEISMGKPSFLNPSYHTIKYSSVKKMTIVSSEYTNTSDFPNCLSFNLPNLRQLSFNLRYIEEDYKEPITIHMPHTSLDLLTWNETSGAFTHFKGTEIYIRLETDAGVKFYVGIRNALFPIDSDRYHYHCNHTRFDIMCKQLKELKIRRIATPESDANLVF